MTENLKNKFFELISAYLSDNGYKYFEFKENSIFYTMAHMKSLVVEDDTLNITYDNSVDYKYVPNDIEVFNMLWREVYRTVENNKKQLHGYY